MLSHTICGARPSADEVIAQTLAQHAELRQLFAATLAIAQQALEEDGAALLAIAPSLARARAVFEIHLAFEESMVLPILRDDPPLGPARAELVLDEHRRQRAWLATLSSEVEAHPDLPTVAVKLDYLLRWLLDDMNEEEHNLLNRDVVRDDLVSIDQCTG